MQREGGFSFFLPENDFKRRLIKTEMLTHLVQQAALIGKVYVFKVPDKKTKVGFIDV